MGANFGAGRIEASMISTEVFSFLRIFLPMLSAFFLAPLRRLFIFSLMFWAFTFPVYAQTVQIVNLSAATNSTTDFSGASAGAYAVVVLLPAGTSEIAPVGVADGGAYDAMQLCPCAASPKYSHLYDFIASEDRVPQRNWNGAEYGTPADALSSAQARNITLAKAGWVKLFIADLSPVDNTGGVSLRVTRPQLQLSVPATMKPLRYDVAEILPPGLPPGRACESGYWSAISGGEITNDGVVVASYRCMVNLNRTVTDVLAGGPVNEYSITNDIFYFRLGDAPGYISLGESGSAVRSISDNGDFLVNGPLQSSFSVYSEDKTLLWKYQDAVPGCKVTADRILNSSVLFRNSTSNCTGGRGIFVANSSGVIVPIFSSTLFSGDMNSSGDVAAFLRLPRSPIDGYSAGRFVSAAGGVATVTFPVVDTGFGTSFSSTGIREDGWISGSIGRVLDDFGGNRDDSPFLWSNEGYLLSLGKFVNYPSVSILRLNSSGLVVGSSHVFNGDYSTSVATAWFGESPTNLNELLPSDFGGVLNAALNVNEKGQIFAVGYRPDEPKYPLPIRVINPACPNGEICYDASYQEHRQHAYILPPVYASGAPSVSPIVNGVLGGGGYRVSDVAVSWLVDAQGQAVDVTNGCRDAMVTDDTRGATFRCAVSTPSGNISNSVVVKRDTTPPFATGAATVAPNAAGWHQSPVAVAFSGTDATSGIASCSPNATVGTEGANQKSPTGTCTDIAGNVSAPVALSGINIDLTPPVVSGSRSPAANSAGWNDSSVVASFTATDMLSGVAADACDGAVTVAGEGAGQSTSGYCRDIAGNIGSGTIRDISIDLTAPTAAAVVTPAANVAGWHKTIPTVSFEGSDAISGAGIAGCSSPKFPSSDGSGQALSGTCTDLAGNVSSPASATVSLDRVSPAVTVALPTDGATYGLAAVVPANFTCADSLSGVATCTGTVAKGAAFDTSTAGTKTFTGTGADNAGNSTSQTVSYTVSAAYDGGLATNRASVAFPGQQVLTSSVAQVVTLTNPGSAPVGLRSITLGGTNGSLFSRSSTCGSVLVAGASCNINVFFRPSTMGAKAGNLIVTTTGGASKKVALSGSGLAPPLTVSTSALAFGGQLQSSLSVAKQVGITNNWSEPVRLTSLTISGNDSANFSRSTTCGATLPAGSFCTASVYFRPANPGEKTGQLNIASQAASSPQVVALTGTGTFLQMTASPTALDFSYQPLFTASTARVVTVTNTGTQLLRLTAVVVTGTDASSFSRSTTCGASLAIGASCDVRVFFRPTVLGTRSATLTISATGTAAKTVALGGVGI